MRLTLKQLLRLTILLPSQPKNPILSYKLENGDTTVLGGIYTGNVPENEKMVPFFPISQYQEIYNFQ